MTGHFKGISEVRTVQGGPKSKPLSRHYQHRATGPSQSAGGG